MGTFNHSVLDYIMQRPISIVGETCQTHGWEKIQTCVYQEEKHMKLILSHSPQQILNKLMCFGSCIAVVWDVVFSNLCLKIVHATIRFVLNSLKSKFS